ncbi:heat-inducible transcriptional repressor HrcA [Edaphobacter dinghuensis]|uniref:Heat-inducible transcription repressor HrcA n=1 Tax=Edaphobacter dinghuensis TaxID=1560005 RepID=A0A917HIF7_9BACT|nr:heat-inducible transcriptional repressor HrcA [Edaphobacter dinghuensis]GGG80563.1 heat-inducible transcription repressor HrcA [Edaphobacter dinghuensis]
MADAERVTARQRAILTAVVESYIETGEPVGSGTIARLQMGDVSGISSATIRNEMAELAEAGLLEQPHTSAGRVPTARAFRMYVEQLSGGANPRVNPRIDAARLPARSRRQIDSSFIGLAGVQAVLERTSHVLATLSSGVGVAIAAAADGDMLEHVHFSRLAPARVLAVVVTRSGTVRDRVLALDRDLTLRELEIAANFLNENFRGWSVERVRSEIARMLEQERSEYQRLLNSVQQLWTKAVPESDVPVQTVYVEGVANLLGSQSVGSYEDRERLREVLAALEAKQRLVELLNAYIDARQESVRVVFDLEEQAPEMAGLVLIAAPARMGGESRGTVGVIGPKRMHYENTMNAVGYIAQVFDRMLHPIE